MKVEVIAPFVDKYDFDKKYNVGDIVEFEDSARVSNLVQMGLAKPLNGKGEDVEDENAEEKEQTSISAKDLVTYVGTCEDKEELYALLEEEKAKEKPRASVIKAIEKRIEAIEA